jgi:hypothetical protein
MEIKELTLDELKAEIKRREDERAKNPVDWWCITTEGDEEGRTIKTLGTCYGHFAELALQYANSANWVLTFERVADPKRLKTAEKVSVHVRGVSNGDMAALAGPEYIISVSTHYGAVLLRKNPYGRV